MPRSSQSSSSSLHCTQKPCLLCVWVKRVILVWWCCADFLLTDPRESWRVLSSQFDIEFWSTLRWLEIWFSSPQNRSAKMIRKSSLHKEVKIQHFWGCLFTFTSSVIRQNDYSGCRVLRGWFRCRAGTRTISYRLRNLHLCSVLD